MNRRGFLRTLLLAPFAAPIVVEVAKKLAAAPIKSPHWFTQMCAGYKGAQFLETGYVYAPYIPLTTTKYIVDPKFAKRYAEANLNKTFYKSWRITA